MATKTVDPSPNDLLAGGRRKVSGKRDGGNESYLEVSNHCELHGINVVSDTASANRSLQS